MIIILFLFSVGKWLFAAMVGYHALGYAYYQKYTRPEQHKMLIEHNGFRLALAPLLMAERDRAYIKEVKKIRDAEIELMADVEDWEVGTWWGQKVYKTVPDHM